jgi:hypothetical protein
MISDETQSAPTGYKLSLPLRNGLLKLDYKAQELRVGWGAQ